MVGKSCSIILIGDQFGHAVSIRMWASNSTKRAMSVRYGLDAVSASGVTSDWPTVYAAGPTHPNDAFILACCPFQPRTMADKTIRYNMDSPSSCLVVRGHCLIHRGVIVPAGETGRARSSIG